MEILPVELRRSLPFKIPTLMADRVFQERDPRGVCKYQVRNNGKWTVGSRQTWTRLSKHYCKKQKNTPTLY
jgi:hypothetical protein